MKLQQPYQAIPKQQIPPKNFRKLLVKSSFESKPVGQNVKKKYLRKKGNKTETDKTMDIRRYLGSSNKFTTVKNASLGGESKT